MLNLYRRFAVLLLLTPITACTTVKPWEHANLSRPEMTLSSAPVATAIESRIYSSKEGSSSHTTVIGGGCDCH